MHWQRLKTITLIGLTVTDGYDISHHTVVVHRLKIKHLVGRNNLLGCTPSNATVMNLGGSAILD